MKNKVKHLYKPNWVKEILIIGCTFGGLVAGSLTTNWLLAMILLICVQIVSGWEGHSQNHSRDPLLLNVGYVYGPVVSGLSPRWWNRKHNLHHMFTNHMKKDEDIQHDYKRYLFEFLFVKWKMDSLITDYKQKEIVFLMIHWLIVMNQKIWIVLVANLIAGFFSASILVGNHEKERTFEDHINLPFFSHQIESTKNYKFYDVISLIFMGGMQYQTEHHFFPQIPFYNLPFALPIIREELKKYGLKVKEGNIFY